MQKQNKIYKPSKDEILQNVLESFEIENIKFPLITAKKILEKVVSSTTLTKQ